MKLATALVLFAGGLFAASDPQLPVVTPSVAAPGKQTRPDAAPVASRSGRRLLLSRHVNPVAIPGKARSHRARHLPQVRSHDLRAGTQQHDWDAVADCESSGDWTANTGNGYYGGLQFSLSTWRGYGGRSWPHLVTRDEQIRIAERVLAGQGASAWPVCGVYL